jgi:hypothetical protein
MADTTDEDFLEVPQDAAPSYAEEISAPARRRRVPAAVTTGAWLAVGLVVGAIGVAAIHSTRTADGADGAPAAATNQVPGFGGSGFGGSGFGGGRLAGEQHLFGTLSAVGASSITVTSTSGTATYPIESGTVLVKDGQRVSSLSSLKVGDTVVVHVYPSDGSNHVEIVIDGAPPSGPGDSIDTNGTTTTET